MKRSLKEKYLYSRLKKQDQDAFAEIYDLYVGDLYRFIYFKVSNVEEAQDLTSEVFLKAWHAAQDNGMNVTTLPAFLYKIARNTVIDHYRKKKSDFSLDEVIDSPIEPAAAHNLSKDFDTNLNLDLIQEAMRDLKDEYREILVLRYVDDLQTAEMAKILDKSKGNIRVLQYRALEALKSVLEKRTEDMDEVKARKPKFRSKKA